MAEHPNAAWNDWKRPQQVHSITHFRMAYTDVCLSFIVPHGRYFTFKSPNRELLK